MLVHLKGMQSKATVLLVVAIAAAPEVVRGQEVVDNGFDAGALSRAEDLTNPVFRVSHTHHGFGIVYSPTPKLFHRNYKYKAKREGFEHRHAAPGQIKLFSLFFIRREITGMSSGISNQTNAENEHEAEQHAG